MVLLEVAAAPVAATDGAAPIVEAPMIASVNRVVTEVSMMYLLFF